MKKKYIYLAALLIIFFLINFINSWNTDKGPNPVVTFNYIIAIVAILTYLVMILIQKIKTRKSTETIILEDKKYINSILGIATLLVIIAFLIMCVLNNR
jgi:amino acid transporter